MWLCVFLGGGGGDFFQFSLVHIFHSNLFSLTHHFTEVKCLCVCGGWGIALLSPFSFEVAMCLGGGGLHCCNHFLELKFLCVVCVWGGGGGTCIRLLLGCALMVGPQHDMPNQTSDFRLQTLYP